MADDKATLDQSRDVKAPGRTSTGSTNTLNACGVQAAQRALGDPASKTFRAYEAGAATLFHGPNNNFMHATEA